MKSTTPAPVHYRLVPGRGLPLAVLSMLLALGLLLLAWLLARMQAQRTGSGLWLATACAYGVACCWAWRALRSLPVGWLVWTGRVWSVLPAQGACRQSGMRESQCPEFVSCALILDLQHAVLLRLQAASATQVARRRRACWVWASRHSDPGNWHALRCALVWAHAAAGDKAMMAASDQKSAVS